MMISHQLLQTKALFKVKVGNCANKRTTSDGESKIFKRYILYHKPRLQRRENQVLWFGIRAGEEQVRVREGLMPG
jgi:hypothetical protein